MSHLKTIIISFIGILAILCGCTPASLKRSFAEADRLMENHPDSVLMILCKIDTAEIKTESDRARYLLLLTQARYKNHLPWNQNTDSVLNNIVAYFDKKYETKLPDDNIPIKASYYNGMLHFQNGDMEGAVVNALKSNEIAEKMHDTLWMARSSELLADIYDNSYNIQEAADSRIKSAQMYKSVKKEVNHRYALCDYARHLADLGNINGGLSVLDSLNYIALHHQPVDTGLLNYTDNFRFPITVKGKNYKKAKGVMDEMLEYSLYSPSCRFLLNMVEIYAAEGNMALAENLLFEASKIPENLVDSVLLYAVYTEYYAYKGDYFKSKEYLDNVLKIQNRVVQKQLSESVIVAQRNYYHDSATRQSNNYSTLWRIFEIVCWTLCLVIVIMHVKHKYKIFRKNQHISTLNTNVSSLNKKTTILNSQNQHLYEKLKVTQCENDNLIRENFLQSERLSAQEKKMATQEIIIKGQAEDINKKDFQIKQNEDTIITVFKERWELLNFLCISYNFYENTKNSGTSLFADIKREIKRFVLAKSIRSLEKDINKYMNNVMSDLRKEIPDLTEEEMKIITFVYAGMPSRAISVLLNLNIKSFYTKRDRLAKKIINSRVPSSERFAQLLKNLNLLE